MNNHWYNEGKEILNQGRSKKQMKGNYKIGAIGNYRNDFNTSILSYI